jgi:uncharacterized protein
MAYPVVHFEVSGSDAVGLQSFYRDAFEWSIDADNPMSYGMVAAVEGGIAGGVSPSMDGTSSVTFYIQVDDLQAALDRVGTTVLPPMDVPGGPSIAMFSDPAGNRIGLAKGM